MVSRTRITLGALALATATATAAVPSFARKDVAAPADAPRYVLRDGSVAIFGNDGMEDMLQRFNALVAKRRPGLRFTMTLEGSSTGLPALAVGVSLVAPLTRDAWGNELAVFRQIHGYDATPIRIGYSGWGPRNNAKTPPAVYVGADSPLKQISLADLRRVFTMGNDAGDIIYWSQLGMTGEAGKRRIHLYGLDADGGSAIAFRKRNLGLNPYATQYEPLNTNQAVIRAVASDPYGIGIAGWVDARKVSENVRVVAIQNAGQAALPSRADVAAGAYPLSLPVQFYVDRAPNEPLDALAKAYLEAALSDEGQAIIGAQSDGPEGYLPLSPRDLAAERAKLAAL